MYKILNDFLIEAGRALGAGMRLQERSTEALNIIERRAGEDTADFIEQHLANALLFTRNTQIWEYAIRQAPKNGMLMEFGVYKGTSINFFANQLLSQSDERIVQGFDWFGGLQEVWSGTACGDSHYSLSGIAPKVGPNVELNIGMIDDTLPKFLEIHDGEIAFIHIDTDTYLPAKSILGQCKERLGSGSLILFDELVGYPNWRSHEYKALCENLPEESYRFLAFTSYQALIEII